jgi:hypothetical protein
MTDIDKTIAEVKAEALPFESWERLTGESSAAYAAFCAYRDYGAERSIRKTAEDAGTKYRVWRGWSMQFKWRERAVDFDTDLDKLIRIEKRKTIELREAAMREATGKMLQAVSKKLDMMQPGELAQNLVTDWMTTAIRTEREIDGLVAEGKPEKKESGQLEINFTQDFEGM